MKTKLLGSEINVGWPESYTTAFLDLSIRSENQVTYLLTRKIWVNEALLGLTNKGVVEKSVNLLSGSHI